MDKLKHIISCVGKTVKVAYGTYGSIDSLYVISVENGQVRLSYTSAQIEVITPVSNLKHIAGVDYKC